MSNISTKSGISSFLPKTLKNSSAKIHTLQAHGILWHPHLEPCFSTFVIIVALLRDLLRHYFHTCLAWSFNTTDTPYIYVPHVYLCLYIKRIRFLLLRIIFCPSGAMNMYDLEIIPLCFSKTFQASLIAYNCMGLEL